MEKEFGSIREQKRKRRKKCYNTKAWQDLRKSIIMEHPLCVDCEKEGLVVAAEECHHENHPFREIDDDKMWEKFLDASKIVPLCKKHHILRHHPEGIEMSIKDKLSKYT